LKVSFSELLTIACAKDAWVVDNMQLQNGNINWNIIFTRPVHDWEVEVVSGFFEMLYSQKVRYGGEYKSVGFHLKRKHLKLSRIIKYYLIM
jgi:hypothetical protein